MTPLRTSVGLKALMAVTGALLVLFLVAHALGNLKIFVGPTAFDDYAAWLRTIGSPVLPKGWYLWVQRAVLILAVLAHIWSAAVLALRARPSRYAHRRPVQGSYAARTMRWGGVIIALFIVYHVLDLTTGQLNPVGDHAHPYANVVADFAPRRWPVTLFYTLAVLAVGLHLSHGLASALRTLGWRGTRERRARGAATAIAAVLCAGYLAVPFAVLTGLVS
jgi:succinate dehydrogenase / fumarate reductase, cytochrome b subunit